MKIIEKKKNYVNYVIVKSTQPIVKYGKINV